MAFTVTIFKNIKTTEAPFHKSVSVVLDRVRNGAAKGLVEGIRKESTKSKRNELKKGLAAVCFSGTFNKRQDSSILEHSGLICLDFDDYESKKDMNADKLLMQKDKYVYSVFTSPSGNGIKVLVKIPADVDNHKNYFNSLKTYFDSPNFDVTCSNVSRVCYESYDPDIYVNEDSEEWDKIEEPEYKEKSKSLDTPTIPITDENKISEILVKWWTKNYPMNEGGRNHNAYILAAAFNDYGINKTIASFVLNQYAEKGFTANEIGRTIDSAYEQTQNFGTKYYEDEEKLNQIKTRLKRGDSKKAVRRQLVNSNLEEDVIDSVLDKMEEESKEMNFWTKTDKGVIDIIPILFKKFLEDNGYYKYCPEGSDNFVFVKVTNNLISKVTKDDVKNFVMNYLHTLDDTSIFDFFAKSVRFFRDEFLTLLDSIDVFLVEDDKSTAYLYYKNCAVKVTDRSVETIDYLDLDGFVWKDRVVNRNFFKKDEWDCDYKKFVSRISNDKPGRIKTMESTIGFLMHGYKSLSYCPAVILNDEVISANPEGGTGKGLFLLAVAQIKKVDEEDGKLFSFKNNFIYQKVDIDTQLVIFDDVVKNFNFEKLFSLITQGITIEKKNKDAIKVPYSKSPKIAITTNYAIKGAGNSFARRKWEIELYPYFGGHHTPHDEFRRDLFAGWDKEEWESFDNYMISCLSGFLETGLVKSKFVNLEIRQLSAETSHEFIEWCGLVDIRNRNEKLIEGSKIMKAEAYSDFITEYPDYAPKAKMTISRQDFGKWMYSYALFQTGMQPEEGRSAGGRWIRIVPKLKVEPQQKLEI